MHIQKRADKVGFRAVEKTKTSVAEKLQSKVLHADDPQADLHRARIVFWKLDE